MNIFDIQLETIFGWVRIFMYLFTSISLFIAAVSFYIPMNNKGLTNHHHIPLLVSLGVVFIFMATSAILRIVFGNTALGVWIINYPVTINMAVICFLSWRSVLIMSRPDFNILCDERRLEDEIINQAINSNACV